MANQVHFDDEQSQATIKLTASQLAQAIEAVEGLPDTTVGKYRPVYELVAPWVLASSANAKTKLFFRLALEVNQDLDSPANLYIREVTRRGLQMPPVGDSSPENIQQTSNLIAAAIFSQMLADGGLPQMSTIIQADVSTAITRGGQTFGGWGGSLFFLTEPTAFAQGASVGKMIFRDGPEAPDVEKFETVTSEASKAVIQRFGLSNDFYEALPIASASIMGSIVGDSDLSLRERTTAANSIAKIAFDVAFFVRELFENQWLQELQKWIPVADLQNLRNLPIIGAGKIAVEDVLEETLAAIEAAAEDMQAIADVLPINTIEFSTSQGSAKKIFASSWANRVMAGNADDLIYGGDGADFIIGSLGNDELHGGEGADTYVFRSGHADDRIDDEDGAGRVVFDDSALAREGEERLVVAGAFFKADGSNEWSSYDGSVSVTQNSPYQISLGGVTVELGENFSSGQFGIHLLDEPEAPDSPARRFIGDRAIWDSDPNEEGLQAQTDPYNNLIRADGEGGRPNEVEQDRVDTLYGSSSDEPESFETGGGNDDVYGDGQNSATSDAGGRDLIETGAGRDLAVGGGGDDWVEGGTEGDLLIGNAGDDVLFGDSSNDQSLTIKEAIANGEDGEPDPGPGDLLSGDAGDDIVVGASTPDFLAGGEGVDVLVGGAGDDTIYGDQSVTAATFAWTVNREIAPGATGNTYTVTSSNMVLSGSATTGAADVMYGGAGQDWMFGGAADDYLEGGDDDDVLFGEAGSDVLVGGAGNDALTGDSTSVDSAGLSGDDYLDGGDGDDELVGGKGADLLFGGAGDDSLAGGDGDDILVGGAGTDLLIGGSGRDTYIFNRGDGLEVIIDTPATADSREASIVVLGEGISRSDVRFGYGSFAIELGGGDSIHFMNFGPEIVLEARVLEFIEFADGSVMTYEEVLEQGFDITGTDENDVLVGTAVTDRIVATAGNDTVSGNAGNDTLDGGSGDDWVDGGYGNDALIGGDGDDTLSGNGGADSLTGDAGADVLYGNDGNDTLAGGAGDDLLVGADGADVYLFASGGGADIIEEQAWIAWGIADDTSIDVARFDASVTVSDVVLARQANGDLTIRYGSGDVVTIAGHYNDAASAIERIEFADGTVIEGSVLDAVPIAPIEGTAGAEVMSGTLTDDLLAGLGGADTYAVYVGMGRDTIIDASASAAEISTLALAQGLTLDGLRARQAGNDLAVDVRGTSYGVVIKDYFSATPSDQHWQIRAHDGTTTQMQDLIDRPDPHAGDVALSAREDYRNGLITLWAAETFDPPLPTHVFVHDSWSQTTVTHVNPDGSTQKEVLDPVTHTDILQYGIRRGREFYEIDFVERIISVQNTSQVTDDEFIQGINDSQFEYEEVTYGVRLGSIAMDTARTYSNSVTFATGPTTINSIVSRVTTGLASIFLTQDASGPDDTISIDRFIEVRIIEDIIAGDSDNFIIGGDGIEDGHVALIDAGGGHDSVEAGDGDFVYGGEGDDFVTGGAIVYGGNGLDWLEYGARQYGGAEDDWLYAGQFMDGGSGNDVLTGISGATEFFINPLDVGVDVIFDEGAVEAESEVTQWYLDSIGLGFHRPEDIPEESLEGLWGIATDSPTYDALISKLYWDWEEWNHPDYVTPAITIQDYEWAAFFYLTLDDLRADLEFIGAPYVPDDIRYVDSVREDLRAHDYQRLLPLYEAGVIEVDTLTFGDGVSQADLTLAWTLEDVWIQETDELIPHAALELSWGANNSVKIVMPRSDALLGTGIERVQFANGDVLSMAELIALAGPPPTFDPTVPIDGTASDDYLSGTVAQDVISGLGGDDTIEADDGDDVLAGGAGADVLSGGGGSDSYRYSAPETGVDYIIDEEASTERYLDNYYDARGMAAWRWHPGIVHPGQYMVYGGVPVYGDEPLEFTFFDTYEEALAWAGFDDQVIYITPSEDLPALIRRDDIAALEDLAATGVLEKDVIELGAGLDQADLSLTFVANGISWESHTDQPLHSAGVLEVRWNSGAAGFDVAVADVNFGHDGGHLLNGTYQLGWGIEALRFADGTELWLDEVLQEADLVVRYPEYSIWRDSGEHVIDIRHAVVRFPDVTWSDIQITREGADLLLILTDWSAQGRLVGWYADPVDRPALYLAFSDGQEIHEAQLTELGLTVYGSEYEDELVGVAGFGDRLYGGDGADVLQGLSGDDTLSGGTGNDLLTGGDGADVYQLAAGDGIDVIDNLDTDGSPDSIEITGIASTDVVVSQSDDDLILTLGSGGDEVRLAGWYLGANRKMDSVYFAVDDVTWNAATLAALAPGGGNAAPVVATPIADQPADEDAAFSFTVPADAFADPDVGDALTYSVEDLPSWLSFDAETRTFSGTPLQADVGSVDVTVVATDGGGLTAEDTFTITVSNVNDAPVVTAGNVEVLLNDSVAASGLFSVTDEDGDAMVQYEFWDDTAGGGHFAIDGVAQSNNPISMSAADLADVAYVAGAEPGTEQVWVRAHDGMTWSAWKAWNITSALHVPNAAPTITATATQTVTLGQTVDAATLFTATDADDDPIRKYEFFDSTAGNGHFVVEGVEQGVNVGIVVDAADLAEVQFAGSATTGSDTVWVRATDGQSWGEWKSWTMNSWPHATNATPVAAAANATVLTNQAIAAASLFSVTDADGDPVESYELWDDVAGGGYWRVNGVQQGAGQAIAVSAEDLANAEYVGGASGGTEQVWVRANDGLEWGAWKSWNMTTALHIPNDVPVITAGTSTVVLGQSVAAASLFSATDADGDPITRYEFWDSTAGNGHWSVDGVEQGVNAGIVVTDLEDIEFQGASATGSDLVWVRAFDGQDWSSWKSWYVNSWPHATNAAPVVTAANEGLLRGEGMEASDLFSVTDADGDAIVRYELWDDVNGGGHWAIDGVQQAAAQAISVEAADLGDVQYVGGANAGTEQVWARAFDGMDWSAWKNWLMSTEGGMLRGGLGPDTLTGEAGPTVLEGGDGDDTISDTEGNNAVSGGEGDDDITTGDGNDIIVGGAGNDTVHTGGGSNVIAFNSGSGIDTIYSGAGASNTLSFGGGIGYDDLALSKDGNDLIVNAGNGDAMVLKDWYAGQNNVLNLQIVHDASEEFDAGSTDPLYNKKVQTFDFLGLVSAFDQALAASPGLTSWAVTNALLQFHLSGADDAALGGDLAYWYGKNGSLSGISLQAAQQVIGASGFGSDAQALRPFSGLQEGFVKLS